MENKNKDIKSLLNFLNMSPCNFLAINHIKEILNSNGFKELKLDDQFNIKSGDKFYVTKNDSAIFAITVGKKKMNETSVKIISAHSDSPGFRVKPHAEMKSEGGIVKLNTEVYGGPILYTWFDRPLSIAGRVILRGNDPLHPITKLIKFDRPLLTIPHLAIHFNRAVNDGNKLSKQKDMLPIIAKVNNALEADNLLMKAVAQELDVKIEQILDFDLFLYDVQPATIFGLNDEFISSGRLDDLSMAQAAIEAITNVKDTQSTCVAAIFETKRQAVEPSKALLRPCLPMC